jgi:UDP-GlcNAc:undecaprenyl-phosphate GlcNAc-1-phosphate transferase
MSGALFFSFVGSLIICMALIPALMATAGRWQFIDSPGGRKVHAGPIAKVGGLALGAGTVVAILMWAPKDEMVASSLIGGLIILLFGAWDDRVGLTYQVKFLGQVLAALVVTAWGGVVLSTLPFLPDLALPLWAGVPVTLILLVGITNAINLADGLDGLAGGLTLLSFAGMAYLAYVSEDTVVMLMMVSVLGGLLGFLRFNTYPARIFMGDAGSQFLGFYLAVSSIVLTDPSRGPYSPALMLFILGLPMLDTVGVMMQRLREGRSPFVGDQNHVHHKLLAMGLSHHEAVVSIYGLQAIMVSLAYLLRWQDDVVVLTLYGLIALPVLALFTAAGDAPVLFRTPPAERLSFTRLVERAKAVSWLMQAPIQLLGVALPAFLVISIFFPRAIPADVGALAAILSGILLIGLLAFPKSAPVLVRGGLYVGSTCVMYLSEAPAAGPGWSLHPLLTVVFVCFAVLILLHIRFGGSERFQTTPLDYLMVLLALVIPVLPEIRVAEINLSLLTAKLIVLFFAFELLLHAFAQRLTQLGLVSLWLLGGLGVRAWWG